MPSLWDTGHLLRRNGLLDPWSTPIPRALMNAHDRLAQMIREAPDTSPDSPQDNIPHNGALVAHRYAKRTRGTVVSATTRGVLVRPYRGQDRWMTLEKFEKRWAIIDL